MWVASATMPDPDSEQHGHSARLLRALIWGGVGLAPVTALVALVGGSDNSVRFAVVLIAVCVVLIGSSMLIRSDPVLLRMHVEDRVGEEVEALRAQLREEIAAAARVTSHRVQALEEELSQVRAGALAAPMGSAWPEPGLPTGGRAVVPAAGTTSGPIQRPAAAGRPTGGAAVAVNAVGPAGAGAPRPAGSATVAAAAARPVGTASGPIPAPRAGAVVPPPMAASVFRPSSGPPSTSSGARPLPRGTAPMSQETGPAPRGTGPMSQET
ncbi:MAG: hypothetical protein QOC94_3190, partial [Actinoplanes sp.]|nr:hypothetical protein [Actinoplanes sp.]